MKRFLIMAMAIVGMASSSRAADLRQTGYKKCMGWLDDRYDTWKEVEKIDEYIQENEHHTEYRLTWVKEGDLFYGPPLDRVTYKAGTLVQIKLRNGNKAWVEEANLRDATKSAVGGTPF